MMSIGAMNVSISAVLCGKQTYWSVHKILVLIPYDQAFRFMVGPGHCPMILEYGPSLSKAVGPVDQPF